MTQALNKRVNQDASKLAPITQALGVIEKMELSELLTTKWVVIGISECIALYLWTRIYKSSDPSWYKVLLYLITIIPIFGILAYIFVQGMPSKAPQHLRATMNHYGQGGRFIGNGSRRFNYDPVEQEGAEDWNPTVEEMKKKNKGKKP